MHRPPPLGCHPHRLAEHPSRWRCYRRARAEDRRAVLLPILPDLRAAIDAMPKGMSFLTLKGHPFKPGDFSGWFARQCRYAGIPPGYAAHGLRKAACRRLAEAGCSASVIAAVTGHKTLRAVEPYVRAADQARMARMGAEAVAAAFGARVETSAVNPALPVCKKG
jgi:integrase